MEVQNIFLFLEKIDISIPMKDLLMNVEDIKKFKFITKENDENIIIV